MTFIPKNSLYAHVLVAVFSFSLMVSYLSGQTRCFNPHDHARMSHTVHKAHGHGASSNSHLPNVHGCHDADSSQKCCPTPSQNSDKCKRDFVLRNRTNTAEKTQRASLSAPIAVDCSPQFSERNFISEISNANNPTLLSLRTVILLI